MLTDQRIYAAILQAIIDQRLPPRTKLGEVRVAALFGGSRRLVEKAFVRLAHDELVELEPNRGAFVASPSPRAAREIFRMRQVIEEAVVREVASRARSEDLRVLRRNVADEKDARTRGAMRQAVRHSGRFHLLLAVASGNHDFEVTVRRLLARTSLVVKLYGNADGLACWHNDHLSLIRAIAAGEAEEAVALMRRHLGEIEATLRLEHEAQGEDLAAMILEPEG
jgi:DNA-binding GntR family transcriptional regulator